MNHEDLVISLGVVLEILAPNFNQGDKSLDKSVVENLEDISKMSLKKCVGLVKMNQEMFKDDEDFFSQAKQTIQVLENFSEATYEDFLNHLILNLQN